jgi:hypothetical protein
MAKRRVAEDHPLTDQRGLTALIVIGVGLTTGAIVATCVLALSASPDTMGQELWLAGHLSF